MYSLPNWVFRMSCYSGGARLPKRPKVEGKWFQTTFDNDRWIPGYYRKTQEGTPALRVLADHNLEWSEYRFWLGGHASNAVWAKCRACGKETRGVAERMDHKVVSKCTRLLVDAYKLLQKDRKCVVCDKATRDEKWGVPMCAGPECMKTWVFELATPQGLMNAITLAHVREQ